MEEVARPGIFTEYIYRFLRASSDSASVPLVNANGLVTLVIPDGTFINPIIVNAGAFPFVPAIIAIASDAIDRVPATRVTSSVVMK
jgi:hypothetical protein